MSTFETSFREFHIQERNGMTARRHILLALVSVFACMGASYRTTNFFVHAPTQEIAQQVGQLAERYRKEKALEWLGKEMPNWPQPCPVHVTLDMSGPSGATSFNFGQDQSGRGVVVSQHMQIQGPLNRLLASVLPHEITHTVFAYHFRCPLPRWADEGGSVLSEDDIERIRHDKLVRQILNGGQEIRLRTLLSLTEYPQGKVMHLYAQGYSLTNYLVNRSDKHTFLNFVAYGMHYGWDQAAYAFYKHRTIEELEEVWLKNLRDTKGQPHILLAKNKQPANQGSPGTLVRLTVPPGQTYQPAPVVRMQSGEDRGPSATTFPTSGRPGYLPDYNSVGGTGWQAAPATVVPQPYYPPVPVNLGPPQFAGTPGSMQAAPPRVSPVGFPQ
jgi:hypothetical protein